VPSGADVDIALATLEPGLGYAIDSSKLVNVNSPTYDGSPVISKNGLALYFTSSRAAPKGGTNIWVATRPSRNDAFTTPVIVANVNSDGNEYPGFISGDGCRLYLSSERPGGLGNHDIYVATKPK
jgi:Tol biopolymer transport system component